MLDRLRGNRWVTLFIISIGLFIILIDTTVVNVAIPSIIKDLHATLPDIEWIISGYAISFAALLITFGRLGDLYGRKFLFLLGLVVFAVASIVSGESSNASILIFARLFQGVGGAMISPSVLSLISSNFSGRERAVAFGIFGAITGVAVAVGPILGGFFTTYYSWRWVFRINVPICLIGLIVGALLINESKIEGKERLDISGMALSTIGFFLLVFGLIEGQNYGWLKPNKPFQLGSFTWTNTHISIIIPTFIICAIALTSFVILEFIKTKKQLEPAINIDFFSYRTYRFGLIAIAVIALGEFSSLFTLPIFLQSIRGLSALQSGAATLPLAIASFIAAPTSARLVNRLGTKWVITTGIFCEFLGLVLISRLTPSTTVQQLIIPLAILGLGIGLAISQNTQVILSEIPGRYTGSASGVLNTVRQVGSALGIAIIGAVLTSQISSHIQTNINAIPNLPQSAKMQIIDTTKANSISFSQSTATAQQQIPPQIKNNPVAVKQFEMQQSLIGSQIKNAVDTSLTQSISDSIRFGSIFLLIGAFLSLFIPSVKHTK